MNSMIPGDFDLWP